MESVAFFQERTVDVKLSFKKILKLPALVSATLSCHQKNEKKLLSDVTPERMMYSKMVTFEKWPSPGWEKLSIDQYRPIVPQLTLP